MRAPTRDDVGEPQADASAPAPISAPCEPISRRRLLGAAGTAAGLAIAGGVRGTGATGAAKRSAPAFLRQGDVTIPLYTTENDPNTLDFYERTIEGFRQQYPDVNVEVSLYQDENQVQFLTTAFETGTDLGIFAPPPGFIAAWVGAGYLLPITPIVERIGAADFLPGTRIVIAGDDYAMPFQSNASALWCRTDLLEGEGLAPPTTYDEFLGALQTLHGKDGLIGISSGVGPVPQLTLQYFTPYIHQAGEDYFTFDGALGFDRPPVLEAIQRFTDVMRYASPGLYNATFQDILTTFISGRAVFGTFPGRMGVNLVAQNPELAPFVTVVPIPAGPFMTGQLHFGGIQHYSVHSGTAHPDETLAFLEYLTTGERSLDFAMTVPGHLLPPLESVRQLVPTYESEFMANYGDWVITLNDLVPNAFSPALSMGAVSGGEYLGRISNICPWASAVWGSPPIDGTMFQEILINGKAVEEAWTEAAAAMGAAAEDWKAQNPDWTPPAPPSATPTA